MTLSASGWTDFDDEAGPGTDPTDATSEIVSALAAGSTTFSDVLAIESALEAAESTLSFAPVGPAHTLSLAAEQSGTLDSAGDFDTFTLDLLANQNLSLGIAVAAGLTVKLRVTGPSATDVSVVAPSAGASAFLQTVPIATAGVYTITVESVSGTGAYTLRAALNGAIETESLGGAANDTRATAQDISGAWLAADRAIFRAVIHGNSQAGTDDWYKISFHDLVPYSMAVYSASPASTVELYDIAGNLVSIADVDGMHRYLPPVAGDYYVRVASSHIEPYELMLVQQASLDAGINDTVATAQWTAGNHYFGSLTATDTVDYYHLRVGDSIYVLGAGSTTPVVGLAGATNLLDVSLDLYGPSGNLIATYDGGFPDGRNAYLSYVAFSQPGIYTLAVRAVGGTTGVYAIDSSGFLPASEPFQVVATTPVAGSLVRQTLDSLTVTFSDAVNFTSIAAGDLTINGVAATGVTAVSSDTARFTFAPPSNGPVNFSIAAGAVLDLEGQSVGAFNASVTYQLNQAPVLNNSQGLLLPTIQEDTIGFGNGRLVRDLLATGAGGDPISDGDLGDPEGVAVTGYDSPGWQFSLDDGANWSDMGPVSNGIARLLAADNQTRIRFAPPANAFGDFTISMRAWDRVTGVNGGLGDTTSAGGSSPFSTNIINASITVTPVNDPPSFTAGPTISALPTEIFVRPGWATNISSGPNETGQNPTFLVEVDNPTLFIMLPTIDAAGTLRFRGGGSVGTAQVTVRLRDNVGTGADTSDPQTFEIRFTNQAIPSGQLDPTFDVDGARLLTSSMGAYDQARDVARQADGKLVVVGYSTASANRSQVVVLRYNVDGTPDASFGTAGRVLIGGPDNLSLFRLHAVEIAADGKIVVAGEGVGGYYVARLNIDGSFDATYGVGGASTIAIPGNTTNFSTSQFSVGLTLQSDGRAIVTRYLRDSTTPNAYRIAVARLNVNGTLDTSFGSGGHALIPWSGTGNDAPFDVVVQSDGQIIVAGTRSGVDYVALRLSSTGQLDTTFGGAGTGIAQVNVGATATTDIAYRVLLQSDGKILLGGSAGNDIGLVRLNTDGTLDTSFDGDGKVVAHISGTDRGFALGLQSDGKIVVGGSVSTGGNDFVLARFTSGGALDFTFDGDGSKIYSFGTSTDEIHGLVIQPDGRIVVVGTATSPTTGVDMAVARFLADGSLDLSFAGGATTSNHGLGNVMTSRVIPMADGRMLVAGGLSFGGVLPVRFGIWRLNRDGSLDTTFGTGGFVITDTAPSTVNGFEQRSDGKLLVLDNLGNRIFRYTADGALDTTFGTAGVVSYSSSLITGEAALTLRSDDSFYVVGYKINSATTFDEMAIVRFTAAGAVDTSFDGDGVALVDVGVDDDRAAAVALQADGKIVVAGYAHNGTAEDFAVARLNTDGSLDTTFSGDGKASMGASGLVEQFRSVLVDPDGKIVAVGVSGSNPGGTLNSDSTLVRFNSDGSLDTSFSGDGIFTTNISFIEEMFTVLRQADGKLYAVGFAPYASSPFSQLAAMRINADGTLDTSFDGGDGVVTYPIGPSNTGFTSSAALDAEGKLLIVSYTETQYRTDGLVLRVLTRATAAASPVLAVVADQTVAEDGTLTFTVTVSDEDTPVTGLSFSATSNSPLFAPEDVTVTPLGGGQWSVTVRPGATLFGSGTLTLMVSDGLATDTQSVTVNVLSVNDAPSFVKGADVSSGAGSVHSISGWATSISAGPVNESGQGLTFLVSATDPSLFDVGPAIDASGRLTFTSMASAAGRSTIITVRLMDSGGTAAGGGDTSAPQTFVIHFTNNTVPSGILDPTFDADGVRTLSSALGTEDFGRDVARQADGKFVVVGHTQSGTFTSPSTVVRYNADGTLDTSFGIGGIVTLPNPYNTLFFRLTAVEITSDGKILVAGDGFTGTFVARLNSDGSLDTAFAVGGSTIITVPGSVTSPVAAPVGLAIQADGKAVLTRLLRDATTGSSNSRVSLVRITTSGTLDTTFGGSGTGIYVAPWSGSGSDIPHDVIIQPDGRIIVVGTQSSTGGGDFFVLRFTSSGDPDATFNAAGTPGKVVVNVGSSPTSNDIAYRVRLDSDGKIVVGGTSGADFGLIRLLADGTLDAAFDGDGKVVANIGATDQGFALAIQSDGKILVGGSVSGNGNDFALARFTTAGGLDFSFDGDGLKTHAFAAGNDQIYGLLVEADGKIIAAGVATTALGTEDFALARFTSDGTLDASFGGGVVTTNINSGSVSNVKPIVLADGRILVSATLDESGSLTSGRYGVWRLLADGSLDLSFGTGGMVVGQFSGWTTSGFQRRSDGKLVLLDGQGNRIIRLTADGALDTSFGTGGVAAIPAGLITDERVLELQGDAILVVGYKLNTTTTFDELAVVRFTADGALDTSFGAGGLALVDVGSGVDRPEAVAVQTDGKIIIGSASQVDGDLQLAVVRLNADGSLDTTFSGDGILIEALSTGADRARSILVQPDGKIVIAGKFANDFGVLRYAADGTRDTSFSGDGLFTRNVSGVDDAYQVVRQADGKLLVVGHSNTGTTGAILTSFRLTADGTLDASFDGGDGIVTYPIGSSSASNFASAALQPDGKLLSVSTQNQQGRYDALLLRYLTQPTTIEPAAVAGVYVRGSTWSTEFLDHLDSVGMGADGAAGLGYALAAGATQTTVTIPWNNVNQITVRFDRDVTATLGSLTLYNSSGQAVAATDFRYIDGRTVEWTVPTLDSDKYLIHLDAALVAGIGGLPLDGEWTTGSTTWMQGSGDGSAGGDFNFRFNVLPGDFDSSGSVAFGEIGQARLQLGKTTAIVDFNHRQDYDGSGSITFSDVGLARVRLGTGLSGLNDPPLPPESLAGGDSSADGLAESLMIVQEGIPAGDDPAATFGAESTDPFVPVVESAGVELAPEVVIELPAEQIEPVAEAGGWFTSFDIVAAPIFQSAASGVDQIRAEPAAFGSPPRGSDTTVRMPTFDLPFARFDRWSTGAGSDRATSIRPTTRYLISEPVRTTGGVVAIGDERLPERPTRFDPADESPKPWSRLRKRAPSPNDMAPESEWAAATSTPEQGRLYRPATLLPRPGRRGSNRARST